MQTSGWLEMPHFLNPISICIPAEIPECVSYNITYQRKAQYAYCGGFFLCRNRYLCEDASRISPMIVYVNNPFRLPVRQEKYEQKLHRI